MTREVGLHVRTVDAEMDRIVEFPGGRGRQSDTGAAGHPENTERVAKMMLGRELGHEVMTGSVP
jgi:hypothetical protein